MKKGLILFLFIILILIGGGLSFNITDVYAFNLTFVAKKFYEPYNMAGYVFHSDGVTQVEAGTPFTINNTNRDYFYEGMTGLSCNNCSGRYSVNIEGFIGDDIVVKAWNESHYGITNVTLTGDMNNVNLKLDHSGPQPPPLYPISGYIFQSEGITQVPLNTSYSINDTNSGFFLESRTYFPVPGYSGYYKEIIYGSVGDTVIVKAWNESHYGITIVNIADYPYRTYANVTLNLTILYD